MLYEANRGTATPTDSERSSQVSLLTRIAVGAFFRFNSDHVGLEENRIEVVARQRHVWRGTFESNVPCPRTKQNELLLHPLCLRVSHVSWQRGTECAKNRGNTPTTVELSVRLQSLKVFMKRLGTGLMFERYYGNSRLG